MTKIAKIIDSATRTSDTATLHLISRSEHNDFVVCWNLKMYEFDYAEWDWGTYCETLERANEIFHAKCIEHDFTYDYDPDYNTENDHDDSLVAQPTRDNSLRARFNSRHTKNRRNRGGVIPSYL